MVESDRCMRKRNKQERKKNNYFGKPGVVPCNSGCIAVQIKKKQSMKVLLGTELEHMITGEDYVIG